MDGHSFLCVLCYWDHQGNQASCVVGQYDAQTVLEIVSQTRANRLHTGQGIAQALDHLKNDRQLNLNCNLTVRATTPSGLVVKARKPVFWRVCLFLMYSCASQNTVALEILTTKLERFIAVGDPCYINAFTDVRDTAPINVQNIY